MFVDETRITIRSGNGGHGCVSFRREKFVPRGGPDGGDGGRGGNVIFRAATGVSDLWDIARVREFAAENGKPGMGKKKTGKSGQDIIITVPEGTMIKDENGTLLADLTQKDQEYLAAKGGKGGRGNTAFAGPTNQTPREYEEGGEGKERLIDLELRLIADVGIVGLPNCGKSTLVKIMTTARPKIADYPFTTLNPNIGIMDIGGYRKIIMADIPGLIEQAHEGKGLGHKFLRHVRRTSLLVHLVEPQPLNGKTPLENFRTVNKELKAYDIEISRKPQLVMVSKAEYDNALEVAAELSEETGREVLTLSALSRINLERFKKQVDKALQDVKS